MGPIHAGDPVSLLAGIISACVGLLIAVPVIVKLLRERRVRRARDDQWDAASQTQRDLLTTIYERRSELRDVLGELEPGDFTREMEVAAAYDRFIDASWAARDQDGLETGSERSLAFLEAAQDLDGTELDRLDELATRIDATSDELLQRRRTSEAD